MSLLFSLKRGSVIKKYTVGPLEIPKILPAYVRGTTKTTTLLYISLGNEVSRQLFNISDEDYSGCIRESGEVNAQLVGITDRGRTAVHICTSKIPEPVSPMSRSIFIPRYLTMGNTNINRIFVAAFVTEEPSDSSCTDVSVVGWCWNDEITGMQEGSDDMESLAFSSDLPTVRIHTTRLNVIDSIPNIDVYPETYYPGNYIREFQ